MVLIDGHYLFHYHLQNLRNCHRILAIFFSEGISSLVFSLVNLWNTQFLAKYIPSFKSFYSPHHNHFLFVCFWKFC